MIIKNVNKTTSIAANILYKCVVNNETPNYVIIVGYILFNHGGKKIHLYVIVNQTKNGKTLVILDVDVWLVLHRRLCVWNHRPLPSCRHFCRPDFS